MSGKSIAVWISGQEHQEGSYEVHINYWRMKGEKPHRKWSGSRGSDVNGKSDLLDIGIWINNPEKASGVDIYLPFSVSRSAVSDCSEFLKNPKIAGAIFNESLEISQSQSSTLVYARKGDEPQFDIYCFSAERGILAESQLTIKPNGEGTQLSIGEKVFKAASAGASSKALYFRIRVALPFSNPFVNTIPPYDGVLQSGHNEIDYIDFRINDSRSLPRDVEEDLARSSASLTKVSFLIAAPISIDLLSNDSTAYKVRVLESEMWGQYVRGLPEHMVVYHWRRTSSDVENHGSISEFSGFAKFAMRRSDRWRVVKYLVIFVLLSALSSWLAARFDANLGSPIGWF